MKVINHMEVRRMWLGIMLATLTCSLTAVAQTAAPAAERQADNVYQEGAILWTQTSGEARALAYQAFNLARMMLDRDLQLNRRSRMRRAIVVDADETVLDNSRYQATLLKNRQNYDAQTGPSGSIVPRPRLYPARSSSYAIRPRAVCASSTSPTAAKRKRKQLRLT